MHKLSETVATIFHKNFIAHQVNIPLNTAFPNLSKAIY